MTLLQELNSHPEPARTLELLKKLAATASGAQALLALHELLLFYKAYPRSEEIRAFSEAELGRFDGRIRALRKSERGELDQTAILGTRIFYPYDDAMARWLMARLGDQIEMDWQAYEERDSDPLSGYLPLLAEPSEQDAVDDPEVNTQSFIEAARGARYSTSLQWVMDIFARAFPGPVRQQIYNSMNLSVVMQMTHEAPSRTLWDDGPPKDLFLWDPQEARAKFDLLAEIRKPLDLPAPVPLAQGRKLLDLVYGTLLPRLRELYPATHGNPAEVYDVPRPRGIRMILWFMEPNFRLPLEAGWGLLVLKNNVPIGYGAGGMVHNRSEIALNVFDTFRGGEAAWLYSQLARMLNGICGAPWIVTRRYQLGYENEEGLGSGSFWFYDKLGFRSLDPEIRALADSERAQIAKHKGYRSSRRILKKLCQADVVLSLTGKLAEEYEEFPLGAAGLAASKVIATDFGGDRDKLEFRVQSVLNDRFGVSYQGWTAAEKSRFAQMGLFALALPKLERWPERDKQAFLELARAKGSACEADYVRAFRKNRKFFEHLASAVSTKEE